MFVRLKNLLGLGPAADDAGARGEAAAADFLRRRRGFAIVARNWRNPRDRREEIDLVARDGEVLVFIEVKTRAVGALVSGFHAVTSRKKSVLRRAATAYLRTLVAPPVTFRLDIVEVALPPGAAPEVQHYENAALFPKHFQP
ncbi:MAG: YraN family protein [Undibacterium sp.]|nr:YraN family protein [Opitutaceae bacterium]